MRFAKSAIQRAGAASGFAVWSPTDKSAAMGITGAGLIATPSGGGACHVRSNISLASGKAYWEITFTANAEFYGIGDNATLAQTGSNTHSVGVRPNAGGFSQIWYNNTNVTGGPKAAISTTACFALDTTAKTLKVYNTAGTLIHTIDLNTTAAITGPYFIHVSSSANGQPITLNAGQAAFAGIVPSGYPAGFS